MSPRDCTEIGARSHRHRTRSHDVQLRTHESTGNSGNGNAPHWHFQVGDRPSLLLSDGLSFVIDAFLHEGKPRTDEIPLQNWLVDFRWRPWSQTLHAVSQVLSG